MKLVWDKVGERLYETGTSQGVLYPMVSGEYKKGVAWNGLTAVTESPSGAEATALYADDIKYLNLLQQKSSALQSKHTLTLMNLLHVTVALKLQRVLRSVSRRDSTLVFAIRLFLVTMLTVQTMVIRFI